MFSRILSLSYLMLNFNLEGTLPKGYKLSLINNGLTSSINHFSISLPKLYE